MTTASAGRHSAGYNPDPEIRQAKAAALESVQEAKAQEPTVNEIFRVLTARRERNHFGDELTVSFTPRDMHRGRHA